MVAAVGVAIDRGLVRGWRLRGIRHVVGNGLDAVRRVDDVMGFECG